MAQIDNDGYSNISLAYYNNCVDDGVCNMSKIKLKMCESKLTLYLN